MDNYRSELKAAIGAEYMISDRTYILIEVDNGVRKGKRAQGSFIRMMHRPKEMRL